MALLPNGGRHRPPSGFYELRVPGFDVATDTPSAPPSDRVERGSFYGRRVGKTLRSIPAEALARLLPAYGMSLEAAASPQALFEEPVSDLRLEIGFGGGEHLISCALAAPDVGFIGVEPFVNGMARGLMDLSASGARNVRVFDKDAALLLARLPEGAFGRVDLLYPDPWPKRRHWKRRFVRPDNLDLIARVLRPGGLFRFASDVPDYVDWTLGEVRAHPAFRWLAQTADDWRTPYEGWPGTRYEAKALKAGRVPTYLQFARL